MVDANLPLEECRQEVTLLNLDNFYNKYKSSKNL